ncbi:tetratricopeptide repeat protein [Streptomyces sp. NPDC056534]|uniref:tetratricopeptide repeat protein n=1 Tax=Streptomyces sp. NPDC056534 TaxID=3345857 RepID=UPI00369744E7
MAQSAELSLRAHIVSSKGSPRVCLREQARLAEVWRLAGDYRRASLILLLTLGSAERVYGESSPEVARLCNQSGVVGKYTGNFGYAEEMYRRALVIFQRVYGSEHDSVAAVYHNLGGLEHSRGRPGEGEPWAALSVGMRERLHGPGHVLVAADAAAWAALLAGCGRLEEAETQLRRALRIFGAAGEEYEQAVTLHNLAALQQLGGEDRQALAGYAQALAAKERVLGGGHPELAPTLVNLAAVYRGAGDEERARLCLERAVRILAPQVAPGHPTLAAARRALESLA